MRGHCQEVTEKPPQPVRGGTAAALPTGRNSSLLHGLVLLRPLPPSLPVGRNGTAAAGPRAASGALPARRPPVDPRVTGAAGAASSLAPHLAREEESHCEPSWAGLGSWGVLSACLLH